MFFNFLISEIRFSHRYFPMPSPRILGATIIRHKVACSFDFKMISPYPFIILLLSKSWKASRSSLRKCFWNERRFKPSINEFPDHKTLSLSLWIHESTVAACCSEKREKLNELGWSFCWFNGNRGKIWGQCRILAIRIWFRCIYLCLIIWNRFNYFF